MEKVNSRGMIAQTLGTAMPVQKPLGSDTVLGRALKGRAIVKPKKRDVITAAVSRG